MDSHKCLACRGHYYRHWIAPKIEAKPWLVGLRIQGEIAKNTLVAYLGSLFEIIDQSVLLFCHSPSNGLFEIASKTGELHNLICFVHIQSDSSEINYHFMNFSSIENSFFKSTCAGYFFRGTPY